MDGFAVLCGKLKDDSHLVCSAGLQLLTSLMSPYFCYKNFEAICKIFVKMKPTYLMKTLFLDSHLSCPKLVDCKRSSLILLDIYLKNNPNYQIDALIEDEDSQKLFNQWKSFNTINSHKAETIRSVNVDVGRAHNFGFRAAGEGSLCMKGVFCSNKKSIAIEEEDAEGIMDDSFGDSSEEVDQETKRKSGAVGDSPVQEEETLKYEESAESKDRSKFNNLKLEDSNQQRKKSGEPTKTNLEENLETVSPTRIDNADKRASCILTPSPQAGSKKSFRKNGKGFKRAKTIGPPKLSQ